MAVAMLAELTDGESRQQILSCLGVDDLTALEAQAKGHLERTLPRRRGGGNHTGLIGLAE